MYNIIVQKNDWKNRKLIFYKQFILFEGKLSKQIYENIFAIIHRN